MMEVVKPGERVLLSQLMVMCPRPVASNKPDRRLRIRPVASNKPDRRSAEHLEIDDLRRKIADARASLAADDGQSSVSPLILLLASFALSLIDSEVYGLAIADLERRARRKAVCRLIAQWIARLRTLLRRFASTDLITEILFQKPWFLLHGDHPPKLTAAMSAC
jgi:hypothetical protein